MSPKNLLNQVAVVSPCSADWDSMIGNNQIRFCEHCNLNVNDLSQITHKQIKRLIVRSNGRFCVRYYPVSAAPLPTVSIPQKVHQISRQISRIAAGAFSATLSLSSAIAQTQQLNQSNASYPQLAITKPAAASVHARSLGGAIIGSILDPNGALIRGANITIANAETKLSLATVSDAEGEYKFESLEAGTYVLKVEAPGFAPAGALNIALGPNARQRIDRSLEVAGVTAEVEIRSDAVENVVQGGAMSVAPAEPLVKAAQENNVQAVRDALLANGNANVRDKNTDSTALEHAVLNGNREMVQILIWAGADVNAQDSSGQTMMMALGEKATSDIVWDLVSAGAKVNVRDVDGDTALTQVAERHNASVLKALLVAGARVDEKNNEGKTAIMIAASEGSLENVKALILAGANINARDNDAKTALTYARESEHNDVVRLLESYGAQE